MRLKGLCKQSSDTLLVETAIALSMRAVAEAVKQKRSKAYMVSNLGIQLRADFEKLFGNGKKGVAHPADLDKAIAKVSDLTSIEIKKAEQLQQIDESMKDAEKTAVENQEVIFEFRTTAARTKMVLWWVLIAVVALALVGLAAFFIIRAVSKSGGPPPVADVGGDAQEGAAVAAKTDAAGARSLLGGRILSIIQRTLMKHWRAI